MGLSHHHISPGCLFVLDFRSSCTGSPNISHGAYILVYISILRSCLAPIAGYSRRVDLPALRVPAAQRFVSMISGVVASLADLPSLSDAQKVLMSLPFELGGCGISDAIASSDANPDWYPFVSSFLFSRAYLRGLDIDLRPEAIAGLPAAVNTVAKTLDVASVDLLQWNTARLAHLQKRLSVPLRAEFACSFVRDHVLRAPTPLRDVLATRYLENTCKPSYSALLAPVFNVGCVRPDRVVAGMLRLRLLETPGASWDPSVPPPTVCSGCSAPVFQESRFDSRAWPGHEVLRAGLSDLELLNCDGFESADFPSATPSWDMLRAAVHVRPPGATPSLVHGLSCLCVAASRKDCHDNVHVAAASCFTQKGFRVTNSNYSNPPANKKMVDFTVWAPLVRIPDVPGPQGTRAFDVSVVVLPGTLPAGVSFPPLPPWDGDNPDAAAKLFSRWIADAKRVAFEPLSIRERAKVRHHLPGTVCEPLVFSALGGHMPATVRRLPRGGASKAQAGVQHRTRQNGLQQISNALLSSAISRLVAFQEFNSGLYASQATAPALPVRFRGLRSPFVAARTVLGAPASEVAGAVART